MEALEPNTKLVYETDGVLMFISAISLSSGLTAAATATLPPLRLLVTTVLNLFSFP